MLTYEDQVFLVELVGYFVAYLGAMIIVLYIFYHAAHTLLDMSSRSGGYVRKKMKNMVKKVKVERMIQDAKIK